MSHGIRETAEKAVRSGLRHILFARFDESEAVAIDQYLQALLPMPSPWLERGRLSRSGQRGRRLFEDPAIGCALCHPYPWFTDLQRHSVGTENPLDPPRAQFDTPSLIEFWRTGPYLHDGSALTIREVLTLKN